MNLPDTVIDQLQSVWFAVLLIGFFSAWFLFLLVLFDLTLFFFPGIVTYDLTFEIIYYTFL